MAVRWVEK
jgi:hypothetical protein